MTDVVTKADVSWLRAPFPAPIADATHQIEVMDFVVVELLDGKGAVGTSYMLGFDYATEVLFEIAVDAARSAMNVDPAERSAVWARLYDRYEYIGRSGVSIWGLAALDIALWDLYGHQVEQPVAALLGAVRGRAPSYGSGGWLTFETEDLIRQANEYLERGLGGYKMKVGRDVAQDADRIRAVRASIGNVPLMIDANQGYSLGKAIELSRRVDDLDIRWFEEPIRSDNANDYRNLREQTRIPLAMGERSYLPSSLVEIMKGGVDVVMPDALRIGGVRGWLDLAGHAAATGIEVSPHYYREFDAPLVCATPGATFVETFFWTDGIFRWDAHYEGGFVTPPNEPGFGIHLEDKARERFLVKHRSVTPDDAP